MNRQVSNCVVFACEVDNIVLLAGLPRLAGHRSTTGAPLIPANLLYSMWTHADYLAGYDQQDAHEVKLSISAGVLNLISSNVLL